MKKYFLLPFCVSIMLSTTLFGQIININPDTIPYYQGGVPIVTAEIQQQIDEIPIMVRKSFIDPPVSVDNSQNDFMRPIFYQEHNCCAQASGVGYIFTYEINCMRNLPANSDDFPENQYPTHFTYNFLNDGDPNNGSFIYQGWDIIEESGCPNIDTYGGMTFNSDPTYWMTGYDKHESALSNRIDHHEKILLSNPEQGLADLKQWLFNHNDDNQNFGGLASFSTNMPACIITVIKPGLPEEGKTILWEYTNPQGINHQLTIVGYDDEICCRDINNDGQYTNNLDVNNDGVINMLDYEKGAFKVANSFDVVWPPSNPNADGYIYWPYRFLAYDNPSAFIDHISYILYPKETYEPELLLKLEIEHPDRCKIKFGVDYGTDANDFPDNYPVLCQHDYDAFTFNGGDYPMIGNGNFEPYEVDLDFNYFYSQEDVGRLFLDVQQKIGYTGDGQLNYFSLLDKRWGEIFELESESQNIALQQGHNWFSIDYDLLIPGDNQIIDQDKLLFSNMVCRFDPVVNNNSTLTLQNGVKLDMYNSTLTIDEGSTFVINDNAIITAKRGVSKIIVNGNIQIGNNVTFTADEGSTIEIYLNNSQEVNIANCIFNNCKLKSSAETLTVSQCNFTNSYLKQSVADLSVNQSDFANSSILALNPTMEPLQIDNSVTISNNDFETAFSEANSIIEIYGYKNFEITNNTIDNKNNPESTYHGISVHYSGSNESDNTHNISNNEILCSFGSCNNELSGITIYSSVADISANYVHVNKIGIQSLGNSEVTIIGNENAVYENETQRIKNNSLYQVYASSYAFPIQMHWNAIYSSDNQSCFVFHDVDNSSNPPDVDVSNNYWGTAFNPSVNLCPKGHYTYEPVWYLSTNQIALTTAQQLFETGINQISDSNYVSAKSTFQQVVTLYPEEEPAISSLKELFYLEPLSENDFSSLKNWYLTDTTILNHDKLLKLAQNLANKCDEKLENYPDAIAWYESIINNPETLQDSIFAIIDLEHLYWQMGIDTNLRSSNYIGNMPKFKPNSFDEFKDKKDELLLLLHGIQRNQNIDNEKNYSYENVEKESELLQNFPNPFKANTTISYNLKTKSNVQLKVFSYTGQLLKKIDEGTKMKGVHYVDLNANNLTSGIYFYSLFINGQMVATKKMLIMK